MLESTDHIYSTNTNNRTETRETFTVTLRYGICKPDSKPCSSEIVNTALSSNISEGGIGFFTDRNLQKGQTLKVLSEHLSPDPLFGEVRWCARYGSSLYRIGLAFQ